MCAMKMCELERLQKANGIIDGVIALQQSSPANKPQQTHITTTNNKRKKNPSDKKMITNRIKIINGETKFRNQIQ